MKKYLKQLFHWHSYRLQGMLAFTKGRYELYICDGCEKTKKKDTWEI